MGEEGQPRYSTEYSNEYFVKYRTPAPRTPGLFIGDDRDTLFKSVAWLKCGLITGVAVAGFMITKEEERMLATAPYKTFRYGLPCVLAGAAYGSVVGVTAKVRGKSDFWNHIVAGLVSGQVIGGWFKSVPMGRWSSVIFATAGGALKAFADDDALIKDTRPGPAPLNFYRAGLFTTRPSQEGIKDSS